MNRHLLPILLIIVVSLTIYANTLNNGFVYDDEYTIENNTLIKGFDNLPLLFNNSAYFGRSGEMSYRPVVTFSYLVDYALYDLKPWGFHLTNLLLHAVNGVLLYVFLTLLLTPYYLSLMPRSSRLMSPALLASILFVSHPVLTEAVNSISYREDLLTFMFYIAALSFYMILRTKPANGRRPQTIAFLYLLSCFAFILALLSKEMAVTLPLIIFCYEWFYGEGKESLISRLFSRYIVGYVAITVFYLYLRFYLFHNPEEQTQAWGLTERFLTLPWLAVGYLRLSLFPFQLSADYVIKPVTYVLSPSFILPFLSLVSLVVSFVLRKRKGLFFGTIFFFITLLPVYNMIPISNPLAERYLYLPMAGFVIVMGVVIDAIGNWNKKLLFTSSILILCVFAFTVMKRNTVWRDNYSLWTDTSRKMPDSSKAHNNLGKAYNAVYLIDKSIEHYQIAVALDPYNAEAYNNSGAAYAAKGLMDKAIDYYLIALRLKPNFADAHFNLGIVYLEKEIKDKAHREFETVLRINPYDYQAQQLLNYTSKLP